MQVRLCRCSYNPGGSSLLLKCASYISTSWQSRRQTLQVWWQVRGCLVLPATPEQSRLCVHHGC